MKGDIYLGKPTELKLLTGVGRKLSERDKEIKKSKRTVDGTLRSDLTARKKLFTINYEILRGTDIEALIDIYEEQLSGAEIQVKIYDRDDSTRTYNVEMKPINRQRITVLGDWLWGNVAIELEEI